ncbi:hypothetical protein [Synechococcus sp. CS-1332]|uniref:hypothetical protein n=1 Tax=Synechococcus sp. CS-1332 TaxID=2847972 RepID=UPI00223BCED0|nr:hypothetical protein [Synechococcus sp. CS-1332]MCT0207279.1 hypothetical protein [Synechococcus sp. CS-1332]
MPTPEAGLVAASFFAAALAPAPGQAIGTTFSFNLGSATASPAGPLASPNKTFTATADGQTLNLVFQNALRPNGNAKPVSATGDGLCIYKAGGAGLNDVGRTNCGRRNPGNGTGVANQDSIELFFDQQVELLSYRYGNLRVGLGNPLLTWVDPNSPVVSTETLFDKQININYAFSNPFIVQANQILTITGTGGGRGTSSTEALLNGLVVRALAEPPAPSSVPGPLPLLGALAAFGWSRRLRSRLSHAAPAASPCDRDGFQA